MLGRSWQIAVSLARGLDSAIDALLDSFLRPLDREEQLERRHHELVQRTTVTAEPQAAAEGNNQTANAGWRERAAL